MTGFRKIIGSRKGATAIEYGLIAALIAVAAIAGMSSLGGSLGTAFNTVAEAADWWQVIEGPVDAPEPAEDDRAYLAQAAEVAGQIDWGTDPWHALTAALKDATGRKGKTLFLPLRLALTGRAQGPDMAALLPLIGRERAIARLNG